MFMSTVLYSTYLFEQMQRRRTHEKLHIQGNIYPLTCAAFIEDSKVRLTLLTQQPLGFSSLKSGWFFDLLKSKLGLNYVPHILFIMYSLKQYTVYIYV